MFQALDSFNERLAGELRTPFAIGIGIHTGQAIVGRMGPPKTPITSAVGDSVNMAARLERTTKELGHAIGCISGDTVGRWLAQAGDVQASVITGARRSNGDRCAR
jgi:adenylate cyclase